MKIPLVTCTFVILWSCFSSQQLIAETPQNIGVLVNGQAADVAEPLAADQWHTITARYQYAGDFGLLTNTYLALCSGGSPLTGFDIGYHLPTNQLAIVKHGFWNATEATGQPGEPGKVIENDQGYIDCEKTTVKKTADEIAVSYQVKFKKGVLKGTYNVLMYIEDKNVNHDGFDNVGSIVIDNDAGVHRTDMPKQWENTLKPKGSVSDTLLLADNGKPEYTLVIPKNAKAIEIKAAGDLAKVFKLISGATFPIVGEDQLPANSGALISIGRTQVLEQSKAKWRQTDLAAEGYAVEVIDKNVYLYGGSGRGLMHGVYSLLEEDLGCRWYSTSSVDTPEMKRFSASVVPRYFVPVLELRDPYIHKAFDSNWSLRNKTNTPHTRVPMPWGGSIRYHYMGHTYGIYFPTQEYFAEHPEYYALVNGKRQPSQLCHTNEDVIRLSIEKTCKIFRDNPDVTITGIGPNDGRGFCDCPDCKKLDDENGGRAGSFFYHVNRIAEGVKKEFPNNHLISLAYLDYATPPTKLKVDPYIIIQLCTDSHAWKYQFCFVEESNDFQKMIKAWHAVNAKIYIWDYTTDYVHYLVPMANWPVVADNTRFNIKNGAAGIMYESEATSNDELRAWVWAKQLWNPDLDTKTLLKDFVFGYYKESAQPMWDYEMMMWDFWEQWHKLPHQCGVASDNPLLNNLQCSYAPDGPMFTPDFMNKMRACFNRAESLAKSEDILARVKKAKISLLYLELSQNIGYYTEFGDFVYGKSMREPLAKKEVFKQYLDEFIELCKKNELGIFGIPITFDKITAKWRACIDMENSTPPKIDLPAEWIFTTDPDDKGVGEKWYANQKFYDAAVRKTDEFGGGEASIAPLEKGLARLHINRGVGWEQQGFPGFDGYGWYFQNIEVPDDLFAKKHLYVYFLGVNEQAWIYVNDELAFERTYASTGKNVGDLPTTPFSSDIKKYLKQGVKNRIAVRVTHGSGLGGIWLPAMLFGTDEECTTEQLYKYRF
jgi:hypothetical protein